MSPRRHHRHSQARRSAPPPPKNVGHIISGPRAVAQVLQNEHIKVTQLWTTPSVWRRPLWQELMRGQDRRAIPIHFVEDGKITQLVGSPQHQGIACRIEQLPQMHFETLTNAAAKGNLLALDRIQDPMNLGAILRSANAHNVQALLCPKDRSAPLSAIAIKASAGAALHTPVLYVTNLATSLDALKEAGYNIIALVAPAADNAAPTATPVIPIHQCRPVQPWVLIAGSEGSGVRPLVERRADLRVTIPMQGAVESLNVSVACAIALYALTQAC